MALDVAYQRVQPQTDLKGSLLFKYRLAKGLTMVSLFAIVLMAASSIFYPSKLIEKEEPKNNIYQKIKILIFFK